MTMRGVVLTMALTLVGASGMNRFGIDFLQENKFKEGVVMLPSGLQYKILRKGDGTDHPTESSPCECHYEGRTAANYPDGPVFDSSYARGQPTTFAPNQVIGGWTEAMQLMVEGDKWELFIPSDLVRAPLSPLVLSRAPASHSAVGLISRRRTATAGARRRSVAATASSSPSRSSTSRAHASPPRRGRTSSELPRRGRMSSAEPGAETVAEWVCPLSIPVCHTARDT